MLFSLLLLGCQQRTRLSDPDLVAAFWADFEMLTCDEALSCGTEPPASVTCGVDDEPPRCLWFDADAAESCLTGAWACGANGGVVAPEACDLVCNVPPRGETYFDPTVSMPGLPEDPVHACRNDPRWEELPMLATYWGTHVVPGAAGDHVLWATPNDLATEAIGIEACYLVAEGTVTETADPEGRIFDVSGALPLDSTCIDGFPIFAPPPLRYKLDAEGDVWMDVEGLWGLIGQVSFAEDAVYWSHPQRCQEI